MNQSTSLRPTPRTSPPDSHRAIGSININQESTSNATERVILWTLVVVLFCITSVLTFLLYRRSDICSTSKSDRSTTKNITNNKDVDDISYDEDSEVESTEVNRPTNNTNENEINKSISFGITTTMTDGDSSLHSGTKTDEDSILSLDIRNNMYCEIETFEEKGSDRYVTGTDSMIGADIEMQMYSEIESVEERGSDKYCLNLIEEDEENILQSEIEMDEENTIYSEIKMDTERTAQYDIETSYDSSVLSCILTDDDMSINSYTQTDDKIMHSYIHTSDERAVQSEIQTEGHSVVRSGFSTNEESSAQFSIETDDEYTQTSMILIEEKLIHYKTDEESTVQTISDEQSILQSETLIDEEKLSKIDSKIHKENTRLSEIQMNEENIQSKPPFSMERSTDKRVVVCMPCCEDRSASEFSK